MKTQISKQHTNAVAVQPQTTFQKEDRMKRQSSTTLKLAIGSRMVITMALSAGAQTVYMMAQDNICQTNPACDTNTLMSFTLPLGGQFTATPVGRLKMMPKSADLRLITTTTRCMGLQRRVFSGA